ncbi:uncharacterized protein I206_101967 [Kwoniella pini CBS 10737]|uniref:Uncharacterized protein n=1 Tax=Kwoniella pini CBS 10737 TaxID=1296096 RepID=A0A1B9HV70_9TREE|nr:uncharacterized protein I206_06942 [Kwoniella pini CBS 10737]OCF47164.1 hypothetical protein I206_06942 [Kwoniella pini CBS 10737]
MTSNIKVESNPKVINQIIDYKEQPCKLFSITQFQCTPLGGRVTCWPIERIFRQCGENKPSIEVTNRLISKNSNEDFIVDPKFIENPPKAKGWGDYHGR